MTDQFADDTCIKDLPLPLRAKNALINANYHTVGDVRKRGINWGELSQTPNFGKRGVSAIRRLFEPESVAEDARKIEKIERAELARLKAKYEDGK